MKMRLLLSALLAPVAVHAWHKGIVWGLDEWTNPNFTVHTAGAAASLADLAATGASHVRIIWTYYSENISDTRIFPITGPSPLATANLSDVLAAATMARSYGLNVTLCPIIDPSWDNPNNGRSVSSKNFVSRLMIGQSFNEAQWQTWFASYAQILLPAAQLAAQVNASMLEIASELDVAFINRDANWRALIAQVRGIYKGPLTIAANFGTLSKITWWDALDAIGGDVYAGLGQTLPLPQAPSVDDLVAAWAPVVAGIEAVVNATGKPFFITEVGYQSRSSCHVRPWGTQLHDPLDDSAWLMDHDPTCQANAYEALLRVWTQIPWFAGVYWWLWRTDPTQGGNGDTDFTPHGKPAEVVLRRWYGNYTCPASGAYGDAFMAPGTAFESGVGRPWLDLQPGDDECDGSANIARAIAASTAQYAAAGKLLKAQRNATAELSQKTWSGFVFGGPDEWSSPVYRYDSAGARQAFDNLVATGANSVEIIAQWYFENVTDTEIYPITDTNDPLRTSTDDELLSIVQYAQSKGLKTLLTPMLDPQFTIPGQNWCRDTGNPGCYWRGQLGLFWGTNCSEGSQWWTWHQNYKPMILHYARLAEQWNVDAFLISHELEHANQNCPDLWYELLAAVRSVFSRNVTAAFMPSILTAYSSSPWAGGATGLDFIGIDCYIALPLPVVNGSNHPALPWQDLPLSELISAGQQIMPPFAALSQQSGKKIVCTEVGVSTRPWAWSTWGGLGFVDPEDCSVYDQCIAPQANNLFFEWYLAVYTPQPWFDGVLFWTWRADPTSGGTSDDGFNVAGKPAVATIASYWT